MGVSERKRKGKRETSKNRGKISGEKNDLRIGEWERRQGPCVQVNVILIKLVKLNQIQKGERDRHRWAHAKKEKKKRNKKKVEQNHKILSVSSGC